MNANSGFPSLRTNLSPFTKDFRGGEQLNEFINQFFVALPFGGAHKKCKWTIHRREEEGASNVLKEFKRQLTRVISASYVCKSCERVWYCHTDRQGWRIFGDHMVSRRNRKGIMENWLPINCQWGGNRIEPNGEILGKFNRDKTKIL